MPQIYRDAFKVLIWLGCGVDGESEALQFLSRLRSVPDFILLTSGQDKETAQRIEPLSSKVQESIRKFFQLPWFGRRWVVQEAVLNPDVVFYSGDSEISWPRLHLAIRSLPDSFWHFTSGSEIRKSLQKLGELWRTWSYLDHTMVDYELFSLLDSFEDFECKEAKDRIYALAGLASDVETMIKPVESMMCSTKKIPLVPDYSLSDNEVFLQVALRRMQSGKIFTTLAYAGALRLRGAPRTLQSWVPDFRLSKLCRTMLKDDRGHSISQARVSFNAEGTLTMRAKIGTPYRQFNGNAWDSCVVKHVFPGPIDSESSRMLQFARDCLHWMYSIPTLVNIKRDGLLKNALCDILLTVADKFGKEGEDEADGYLSNSFLNIVEKLRLEPPLPKDFPKANERGTKATTWFLLSLLDDEENEANT